PAQYPAGTLAVPSREGGGLYVRQNGGLVWLDALSHLKPGPWRRMGVFTGNNWAGSAQCRFRDGGLDVQFTVNNRACASNPTDDQTQLPSAITLNRVFYTTVFTTAGPANYMLGRESPGGLSGRNGGLSNVGTRPSWTRGSFFVPDYFLD